MGNMEKKEVVVIGPARSGTSMVAGILYHMGVDMGQGPNPTPSNPKGDFEDDDFRSLNREIFSEAKPGSNVWFPPTEEEIDGVESVFEEKICKLINARDNNSLWGWKNPWNVMAVPLFIPFLDNPHLIFVFRSPDAIARSGVKHTKRYEKLTVEEAYRSAVDSNEKLAELVDRYKGSLPIHVIKFEEVMKSPDGEVKKLSEFLGIELSSEQLDRVTGFIIPREEIKKERKLGYVRRMGSFAKLLVTNPKKAIEKLSMVIGRRFNINQG